MSSPQFAAKRCGVRFNTPAIIIVYQMKSSGKLHRRTMPLRHFTKNSIVQRFAEELKASTRHKKYLEAIPLHQLVKLVTILKDKLNGIELKESIEKNKTMDIVDPEEDLNLVDEETLKQKKAIMDDTFEKNQKLPGDADFAYDVEMDFESGPIETCDWDSDKDSDDGF